MPNQTILSDYELQQDAISLSGRLDANATVRLYKNAPFITNNQPIGTFDECTFAGYAGVALAGRSLGTVQLAVGVWELRFSPVIFSATGGPSQFINGWYLTDGAGRPLGAQALSTPLLVSGGTVFSAYVRVQLRGLNVACP